MSDQPEIGAGNVPIVFADEQTVTLKPSLEACQGLCRLHGNLSTTVGKVLNGDIDTITSVILLGMGSPGGQRARIIPKLVYETGVYALSADVIRFINVVANGGKPVTTKGEDEGDLSDGPPETSEATATSTAA